MNKILIIVIVLMLNASCKKDKTSHSRNIYTAGNIIQGSDMQATYWKNGQEKVLSTEFSVANDILVHNGDIYVTGWINYRPVLWVNDSLYELPYSGIGYGAAGSIVAYNNDIYISGADGSQSVVWKNGTQVFATPKATATISYFGIKVINGDFYYISKETTGSRDIYSYWKNNTATAIVEEDIVADIALTGKDITLLCLNKARTELYTRINGVRTLKATVKDPQYQFWTADIETAGNNSYISCTELDKMTLQSKTLRYWKNETAYEVIPDKNFAVFSQKIQSDKLLSCGRYAGTTGCYYDGQNWVYVSSSAQSMLYAITEVLE